MSKNRKKDRKRIDITGNVKEIKQEPEQPVEQDEQTAEEAVTEETKETPEAESEVAEDKPEEPAEKSEDAQEDKAEDAQEEKPEDTQEDESEDSQEGKAEGAREDKSEDLKPKKEKKEKKKKESKQGQQKLRYTVLLVPNNEHRVLQFRLSFDFLIFMLCIFGMLFIGLAIYVASTSVKLADLETGMEQIVAEKQAAEDENILLQAQIEELEGSLREAKVSLDASKNIQQQEAEKHTQAAIPKAFPVDNAAALPTKYTDEMQYVEFTTGYGTKVIASADGTVKSIVTDAELGYILTVDHGNGYESIYSIKGYPVVKEGTNVLTGSPLFTVDADNVTLRYQIKFNGIYTDPMTVIEIDG